MYTMGSVGYFLSMLVLSFYSAVAGAVAPAPQNVTDLQHEWEKINYQLKDKEQIEAFEDLLDDIENLKKAKPKNANILIWSGIIESTYAGAKGGLTALKYAKMSKKDLEKALKIEPDALQGSAYTSLGTLYYNVPGWPISFGDDDKAEDLLKKALKINPNGIDANYFYGKYLLGEGKYEQAQLYLNTALKAPPRIGREIADSGRAQEIKAALKEVAKKLH